MNGRGSVRALAIVLLLAAIPASRGAERVKIADTPAGTLPSDSETRLVLRGFSGEIRVRLGAAGEVRYRRTRAAPSRGDLPVEVFREGSSFEITVPEGGPREPGVLEVNVPARMGVSIEAADAQIAAQGLRSGIEVRGSRLELDARAIQGSVALSIEEGRANLENIGGELRLEGAKLAARLVKVGGALELKLSDSTFEGQSLGALAGRLERTAFKVTELAGPLRLETRSGSLEIRGMQKGGELQLTGTPLLIQESRGDVDVQTDSEVRFLNTDLDLHVDSYGGSVHGNGNSGLLEVKTSSAEVVVAEVSGPTRVSGVDLKVDLQHVAGDIFVEVVSSQVAIADASSEILVVGQNSDVVINRAATEVEVRSAGGDVHVLDVHGPLAIEADGNEVEVSLLHPFAIKDSVVKNDGGGVALRLPPNLGIRLLAETRFGRIQNDMPSAQGGDDASMAELQVGPQGGDHATLRVTAARDIVLSPR